MRKRFFLAIVFASYLLTLIFTTAPTFATTAPTFEILTPAKHLSLKQGRIYDETVTVKNLTEKTLTIETCATPYSISEDGTTYDFGTTTSFTELFNWITFKTDTGEYREFTTYTIKPQETTDIKIRINVPYNVSGGQYATVFVKDHDQPREEGLPDQDPNSYVVFFATIPLPGTNSKNSFIRSGELGDLRAGLINSDHQIGLQAEVVNTGNIDFQAELTFTVLSLTGENLYENSHEVLVLPGGKRVISALWTDTPSFGLYRVNYEIKYLDEVRTGEQLVLIIPAPVIIATIILIVAAVFFAIYLEYKHR